jgi:phage tail sheath gpL-like
MFGTGSMLARMVAAFFASNTTQQLWAFPSSSPLPARRRPARSRIASAPTASGVLTDLHRRSEGADHVASTDTASAVATNLAAAINARPIFLSLRRRDTRAT